MSVYSETFYQHQKDGSLRSAREIVPLIMEVIAPESVIDVGCGLGTWLATYQQHGVSSITGIDGDYINPDELLFDKSHFKAGDLTKPFQSGKRFDLAQSLEVAEHLDQEHAESFIANLCTLSDVILFSAAVPFQLGTHHVNEQFIDYWIRLFENHGYHAIDALRPKIWDNTNIEVCYRQNILVFATEQALESRPLLASAAARPTYPGLSIIHPELYEPRVNRLLQTLFETGIQVHKNGNLPLAQDIYQKILDFNPHFSEVWDAFGQLAAQAGEYELAVKHLSRATGLKPAATSYLCNLAQVYIALKDYDNARSLFEKVLTLEPDNVRAIEAIETLSGTTSSNNN